MRSVFLFADSALKTAGEEGHVGCPDCAGGVPALLSSEDSGDQLEFIQDPHRGT